MFFLPYNHLLTLSNKKGRVSKIDIMKKILVVENTVPNFVAAKKFFSTISGYEFIYALDRKSAELLLHEVDALITDKQIPYVTGEVLADYHESILEEMKMVAPRAKLSTIQEVHGFALMAKAHAFDIPVVMVTEHGGIQLKRIRNDNEVSREVKTFGVILSQLDPYSKESFTIASWLEKKNLVERDTSECQGEKQFPETWHWVWQALKKQF
jgi:hypothetical protein